MRASIIIAASLAGLIAGAVSARAADLSVEPYGGGYGGYGVCCGVYQPVPQVVIYDDEPGVVVRHWWLPPWRNRHYYPHGGVLKRRSSASQSRHRASRAEPRKAPQYMHYLTNPRANAAPLIAPDVAPLPPPRPYAYRQSPPPAAAP